MNIDDAALSELAFRYCSSLDGATKTFLSHIGKTNGLGFVSDGADGITACFSFSTIAGSSIVYSVAFGSSRLLQIWNVI